MALTTDRNQINGVGKKLRGAREKMVQRSLLPHVTWTMGIFIITLLGSMSTSLSFSASVSKRQKQQKNMHALWGKNTGADNEEKVVVAMTREDGKNDKLRQALLSHPRLADAIQIEELPCIEHASGTDLETLGDTLSREESWDYVAVTSPEAARVLAGSWDAAKDSPPEVAAVGKATQETLEKLGINVAFCPSKATAQTLVEELPAKGDRTTLLYPASQKAQSTLQDGLSARGFDVTRLNTYDTVTATWNADQKELARRVRVTCFGSPSAVKGWLKNTDSNKEVLAACIGETSAKACRKQEWAEDRIFRPEKPGIAGWAEAVADALESIVIAHA